MISLLRDRIIPIAQSRVDQLIEIENSGLRARHPLFSLLTQWRGRTATYWYDHFRQDVADLAICLSIAEGARTILFDPRQALALRSAMQRFTDRPYWRMPWPELIIQFDQPIAEHEFFVTEERHYNQNDDPVLGIVLGQTDLYREAIAWHQGDEIQRVRWTVDSTDFRLSANARAPIISAQAVHNKRALQLISMAILMYLNAENIEIAREDPGPSDPGAQPAPPPSEPRAYRAREVTRLVKYHYADPAEQAADQAAQAEQRQGGKHSYIYEVGHHFRQLANGKVIVVKAHDRGVANPESTRRQRVKHVPYTPKDPRIG